MLGELLVELLVELLGLLAILQDDKERFPFDLRWLMSGFFGKWPLKIQENGLKIAFLAPKWAFVVPKRHGKIRESQPSPREGRL